MRLIILVFSIFISFSSLAVAAQLKDIQFIKIAAQDAKAVIKGKRGQW